jgi:hypothetical protein
VNHRNLSTKSCILTATLILLGGAGCCVKVVRPPPLVVGSAETGEIRVVKYPAYILVHDSDSFWDAHQIKDNVIGLTQGEVVHWVDLVVDGVTPGPRQGPRRHHNFQKSVEWIKNNYAQLPDCAPVRIVDGLFSALGPEKNTLIQTGSMYLNPISPTTYCFMFTRAIYMTRWVQDDLGELNTAAGYLVPWKGPFIPRKMTRPINRGVNWTQSGAIALDVHIYHKISLGLDHAIDGGETAWGKVVWLFVWNPSQPKSSLARAKEVARYAKTKDASRAGQSDRGAELGVRKDEKVPEPKSSEPLEMAGASTQ